MSKVVGKPKKGLEHVCMCVCVCVCACVYVHFFYSQMGRNFEISSDAGHRSDMKRKLESRKYGFWPQFCH